VKRRDNPYVPGAGLQPPELAGRDDELETFEVALDRANDGMATRGLVLYGLRGVGKTVLLQAMRAHADDIGWATAKVEAKPSVALAKPLAEALTRAVNDLDRRGRSRRRVQTALAAISALGLTAGPDGVRLSIDAQLRRDAGIPASVDLTTVFTDLGRLARDNRTGVAVFVDELQDVAHDDLVALCAACHEMGQLGYPVLLVGAGLPHVPAVLAAARSYAERLFTYLPIDKLAADAADHALIAPAARYGVTFTTEALTALAALTDRYAYFIQAYGQATWDAALQSPITADDVAAARPAAETLLAAFFGSRYERATPAERAYLHAMAQLGDGPVTTQAVARAAGRPIRSLSPVRDAVIRKTLVYSPERGYVTFSVPHFAAYLRQQDPPASPTRQNASPARERHPRSDVQTRSEARPG
jgi:hypothetical protein